MFSSHRMFMLQLRLWLRVRFDLDPEDGGDCMPHGRQNDTFNCGPATSNTIAHFVFKEPLWKSEKAIYHRIQWFLRFFRAISHPVEVPSSAIVDAPTVKEQAAVDIDVSVAIALGDHNFPDLPSFIANDIVEDMPANPLPPTRQYISLLELL